jgi:DNA-binding LytR/AlgR family response regulator
MKRDFIVALCDTQKNDIPVTEAAVKEWAAGAGQSHARIETFSEVSQVKEKLADGFGADIYIIGIPAHGAGGIETARVIRLRQPDVPIIFLAGTRTSAYDAYELHAIRYILKPTDRDELFSALDLAYLLCRTAPVNTITVRMTGETRSVNADDVVFVENNVRLMRYVLRDGSALTGTRRNVSFEEYFAPLLASGRFVQPHKSFIINIRYIRAVKTSSVIMTNGVQIPISRRHLSEVQEAYSKYGI